MRLIRARGLVAVGLALLIGACGSDGGGGGSSDDGSAGGGTAAVEVVAADFAFDPSSLEVEGGAEVELTFTNQDDVTHSFTADDLDVEIEAEGGQTETTTFTAPEEGTVEWHCKFHSDMTGEISVGGGSAGSQGGKDEDDGGGRY